ncbi:ABC transporter permease [Halalkalirubrum salinum]|uniref:ABC transporter permease n=1 Tax=Halalkalirubrum salinum TaxID=2563889 RepID=UPI0010FAFF80|nr:ABC transporter permease subunit [Halalkalirubrum salinum]
MNNNGTTDGDMATAGEIDPDERAVSDGGYVEAATDTIGHVNATASTDGWRAVVRHIGIVGATEYRLAVRSRWVIALAGLFTLFGAMILTFSGSAVGPEGLERVVASLASLAVYLVPLAALAFGYDAIVGREADGWLAVVLSLPIARRDVVVGTYLGRLLTLTGAVVVGFGFTGVLLLREFGAAYWGSYLQFFVAAIVLAAAFLAIATLISTIAREKTHALGAALLVWVWFVLIHDLLSLGFVAAFSLPDVALSALVLANPASAFRVLVLSGLGATTGGFADALAGTALSTSVLAATLLAWCILPIATAAILIDRRRL